MFKTNKRAERRKHSRRMKRRALKVMKLRLFYDRDVSSDWLKETATRISDHIASCSCYMCGNPRKHFELETMQEKRNDDNTNIQLRELQED